MYRFLVALPLLLMPATATADAVAGKKKAQLCLLCHRVNNPTASLPTLEGQPSRYLYEQLKAFRERRRDDAAMQQNASSLSEQDMRDIVEYFSSRPPIRSQIRVDQSKAAIGEKIALKLRCARCHKPNYPSRNGVPILAGMHPRYAGLEIVAFTKGQRAHPVIRSGSKLSYDDAMALGQYFALQK